MFSYRLFVRLRTGTDIADVVMVAVAVSNGVIFAYREVAEVMSDGFQGQVAAPEAVVMLMQPAIRLLFWKKVTFPSMPEVN
jgi:hypothetical protein